MAIDTGNLLDAVACPSVLQCTAVDTHGREVTFNPTHASAPSPAAVPGANALTAIACDSVTQCFVADNRGNGFSGLAPATGPPPPISTAPPTISGTTQQDQTLSEHHGSWTNAPEIYSYQWLACDKHGTDCNPIFDAGGPTYTPQTADVGHTIRVQETATNAAGPSAPSLSTQTSVVPRPPTVIIGRVALHRQRIRVLVKCKGTSRQLCAITITLTTTQTINNPTTARKRRAGIKLRPVRLAAATVNLAGGQHKILTLRLTAAGKRLLSKRHTVQATLTVVQAGRVILRRRIALKTHARIS
jgi:hypothetical protein